MKKATGFTDDHIELSLNENVDGPRTTKRADARLLPDPVFGFPIERRHADVESDSGKMLDRLFPSRGHPAILHFSADWVKRRDQTTCELALPRFEDPHGRPLDRSHYLGKSWSAIVARDTVGMAREESNPVPRFDDDGVPAWECADIGVGAQCKAIAVFRELDADETRDLNLLLIGAGLSLGTALFFQGLLELVRPGRDAARR
jgi:hypothetical protein